MTERIKPGDFDKIDCEPVQFKDDTGCPDCGSVLFHPGPRGGMAHNIRCAECGSKFWYSPPFTPLRIESHDSNFNFHVKRLLTEFE
jgi:DNA-directed RNA polymerase subunit RPC12/RpoP